MDAMGHHAQAPRKSLCRIFFRGYVFEREHHIFHQQAFILTADGRLGLAHLIQGLLREKHLGPPKRAYLFRLVTGFIGFIGEIEPRNPAQRLVARPESVGICMHRSDRHDTT